MALACTAAASAQTPPKLLLAFLFGVVFLGLGLCPPCRSALRWYHVPPSPSKSCVIPYICRRASYRCLQGTLLPGSRNPLTAPNPDALDPCQRSPVPCPHTLPVPLSTVPISNPFRLLHSQWRPPQAASQRPSQMRANPCLCLIPPQSIPHATPVPFLMRNASCYPLFRSISVASVLRASH